MDARYCSRNRLRDDMYRYAPPCDAHQANANGGEQVSPGPEDLLG